MHFFKSVFAATLIFGCAIDAAPGHAQSPADYDSDVYAFMPNFVIDTKRGIFLNGVRGLNYPLTVCSTVATVCFSTEDFSLRMPRECEARRDWLQSEVAKPISVKKKRHLTTETLYFVSNPDKPKYGFLVGDSGVSAIIFSPIKPVADVVSAPALQAAMHGERQDFAFGEILSAVRLGRCQRGGQ